MSNVIPIQDDYDDSFVNRFKSKTAGSFSYYGGYLFKATKEIKAGDELFADYGEEWLNERKGSYADFVPRKKDFRKAAAVLRKIRKEIEGKRINVSNPIMRSYKAITSAVNERIASLLPDSVEQFQFLLGDPDSDENYKIEESIARSTIEKRTLQWIEKNGICLDLIKPGKSSIPDAGKGAFAKSFIKKDTIISPVPLLTITDRNLLKIRIKNSEILSDDILLNYCFGHKESHILLCPGTNMILINHCSGRMPNSGQCDGNGPNAKIRWSTGWDPDTAQWLKYSLEKIQNSTAERRRGLSFEVVAIRDIRPGEEIFIDYGINWENAYKNHLANWNMPIDDGSYSPVKLMIENKLFRTSEELKKMPYPDNVVNACYFNSEYEEEDHSSDEDEEEDEDIYGEQIEIVKDGSMHKASESDEISQDLFVCDLKDKLSIGNETVYTVRIFLSRRKHIILSNYPEESITFKMRKYKSDQHIPGAFRHFIEIADDIFPEQWKFGQHASAQIRSKF